VLGSFTRGMFERWPRLGRLGWDVSRASKASDSEKFHRSQIDFVWALWGDASPATSRKARGGEVWIVEEV
jgi:hypothetical protein